jgi:hypothetical protein
MMTVRTHREWPESDPGLAFFLKQYRPQPGITSQREPRVPQIQKLEIAMKNSLRRSFAFALITASLSLTARADSPGVVDFGKFTPPGKGSEFVEVQVRSNLLNFAALLVEKQEPEAAKLLRGVQLVRVNVIGLTDENREEIQKRVQRIRQDLDGRGWERNVNAQGKNGEDVGVYTQTQGGTALAGVAITVIDPKNVVLVNVVGDIRPEQIAALGESLHIKQLKEIGVAVKK